MRKIHLGTPQPKILFYAHKRENGLLYDLGGDSKVTLQKHVPENFRSSSWKGERRVSHAWKQEQGPPTHRVYISFIFII